MSEKHNKKQILCPIVVQCKNGSFQQGKAPCGSFLSNLHDKKKVFENERWFAQKSIGSGTDGYRRQTTLLPSRLDRSSVGGPDRNQ